MKYKLTRRETTLLVILILLAIVLCYYKFVLTPINDSIQEYQDQKTFYDDQITIYADELARTNELEAKVQALLADPDKKEIPAYNNETNLLKELHNILLPATDVTITDLSVTPNESADYIMMRQIELSYTTDDYKTGRSIVDQISDGYANEITDFVYTYNEISENYVFRMSVIYFELQE